MLYYCHFCQVHTSVDGDNDWNECFTSENVHLPTGYYFGVSAATGDLADNHNVINIRVFDVDQNENPVSAASNELTFDWLTVYCVH